MSGFNAILTNLESFIKKYYSSRLLKGLLLLTSFGGLFFLGIGSIEYWFWFNSKIRAALLVLLVCGSLALLYYFVGIPLLYLFKVKNGLAKKEAALLIGKHFPEIDDKLFNVLELSEDAKSNELLRAAIEQKSAEISTLSFSKAIDYSTNKKYAKYLIFPVVILIVYLVSGRIGGFFQSYNRVTNYDMVYEKPAPFRFVLEEDNLTALQFSNRIVRVTTLGKVRPEKVYINIDGVARQLVFKDGFYEYEFTKVNEDANFHFFSEEVSSKDYNLKVIKVPTIEDFRLELDYPSYVNFKSSKINSSGSVTVPEGTRIKWKVSGNNLDEVAIQWQDSLYNFSGMEDFFAFEKNVSSSAKYDLITSNKNVKAFERLSYKIDVIKDDFPKLKIESRWDSLDFNKQFFMGFASDDYGLSKLVLKYKVAGANQEYKTAYLEKPTGNVHQFFYEFPKFLEVEEGQEYEYFFQIYDNDAINGAKSVKSAVFTTNILNNSELNKVNLQNNSKLIDKLENRLMNVDDLEDKRDALEKDIKSKQDLNFSQKQELQNFVEKQRLQENLLEQFSKELKENLEKNKRDDEFSKLLQERLERQELEARKNKRLMEELNKLADKINKEELQFKLEELSKSQAANKRNLKQLVELTKRYYVTEKVAELARDLDKLSDKQLQLAKLSLEDKMAVDSQKEINEKFNQIKKELEEVKKDNQELKKPIKINAKESDLNKIQETQKNALEEVQKHQGIENTETGESNNSESNAKQKQRSSGEQLKILAAQLNSGSTASGGSSIAEDAEMLRQILDNLVIFSFKQEGLMERMQGQNLGLSQFSASIKEQKELKNLFSHIDDSLFALSLRQAELSEFVNKEVEEVYYNTDKALEAIADNKLYQGVSYQQYVLTASNNLADYLAKVMDNMQESMQSGNGQGQGNDSQLPDIISRQKSLGEKMGQSGQGNMGGKQGDSKSGEGEGNSKEGANSNNKNGKGKEGEVGENGTQGNSGSNGKKGTKGNENGNSSGMGSGSGFTESELQELFEIYKQQQNIRTELEKQLANMIQKEDRELARKLVQQMKNFEDDLLENGITQRTRNRATNIQQQLLKLENAEMEQGKKKERKSRTGSQEFRNNLDTPLEEIKKRFNQIEILNKQALPLQQNYQGKVKVYFKKDD